MGIRVFNMHVFNDDVASVSKSSLSLSHASLQVDLSRECGWQMSRTARGKGSRVNWSWFTIIMMTSWLCGMCTLPKN